MISTIRAYTVALLLPFVKYLRPSFNPCYTSLFEINCLLDLCSRTTGAIVEIGCNEGATTLAFALKFPDRHILAIDWSNNKNLSAAQRSEVPDASRIGKFVTSFPYVSVLNKDSKTIGSFPGLDIGFFFIDGDHSYEGVKNDSRLAFKSARPGTIIAWHDYGHKVPSFIKVKQYLDILGLSIKTIPGTQIAYYEV